MYLLGAAFFFCVVTIYGVLFIVGLIAVSSESFHDRKKKLVLKNLEALHRQRQTTEIRV